MQGTTSFQIESPSKSLQLLVCFFLKIDIIYSKKQGERELPSKGSSPAQLVAEVGAGLEEARNQELHQGIP